MNKDISDTSIPALRKPKCMASVEKSKERPFIPLIANGKPNESLEVLDPKNMEFSCLVELLHPKFVSEYLERCLLFLTQNLNEMCFPDIAPYKAAFLERIVTNPCNLKSNCFNESSIIVASKIINVLDSNKSVFKWIFAYENGKSSKSVLVFKKQYLSKESTEITPKPRESSKTSTKSNEVPLPFKKRWLSNTLQFTKDDSRLTLEYPKMPEHYADFIRSLIWRPDREMEIENKSFLVPLWEAMRIFALKYDFRLTSTKHDVGIVSMILEKVPKKAAAKKIDNAQSVGTTDSQNALFLKPADRLAAVGSPRSQTDSIISPVPPTPTPLPTSNLKKAEQKLHAIINAMPSQFLSRTLKEFKEFIEDKPQASLLFLSATEKESVFLQRLYSMFKTIGCVDLYPEEHRPLVRQISTALSKRSALTIEVKLEKMEKRKRLRDVRFQKVIKQGPLRPLGPPKQLPVESPDGAMQPLQKSSISQLPTQSGKCRLVEEMKTNPFLKAVSLSEDWNCDRVTDKIQNKITIESQPSTPSSVTKFVTKSTLDVADQSVQSGQSSNRSSSRDGLSKAKKKMLEALSVPVQCDKAERMMMLMGWQGGALGARGEGITEPILPALQIKAGAGLGHVAPVKPSKPVKAESVKVESGFRIGYVKHILQFIRSDADIVLLEFEEPLTDKEKYFVAGITKSWNRRKNFGNWLKDECHTGITDLCKMVLGELCGTPLRLTIALTKDKQSVKVSKEIEEQLVTKDKRKLSKQKQIAEILKISEDPEQKDKDFKIKIDLLKQVLAFVTSDSETIVINVKEKHPAPKFYDAFFENVVAVANKKMTVVYKNMVDNELYKAIVEAVDGFCLHVTSEDNGKQEFTLSKRRRKRFINSALPLGTAQITVNTADPTSVIDFAVDDETDDGTWLSEDKSWQSNNNFDKMVNDKNQPKIEIEKDTAGKRDALIDEDKTDTEKDYDDEPPNKDLKVDIYEDDWLNCCDSESECETNNNYVIKTNDCEINTKINNNKVFKEFQEVDYKTIRILPKDFPNEVLDTELAIRIQNAILDQLKLEVSLPKLRCLGIQKDCLVYNCRNENSCLFLSDFIEKSHLNLKSVSSAPVISLTYKLEFKINSLLQNNVRETFVNFELYNSGLKTDKWEVVEVVAKENCLVTQVFVDFDSYNYICDQRFSLDLGFDTALFRLAW